MYLSTLVTSIISTRYLCLSIFQVMEQYMKLGWISNRTVHTATTVNLPSINSIVDTMIHGTFRTRTSADKVENKYGNGLRYPTYVINALTALSDLLNAKIVSKKGFILMILCILDWKNGYLT